VCGGVAELLTSDGVEGEVIDFDDLDAGDPPPALTEAQRALLSSDLLAKIEDYAKKAARDPCTIRPAAS
jgi:hypothetical protein